MRVLIAWLWCVVRRHPVMIRKLDHVEIRTCVCGKVCEVIGR